MVDRLGFDSLTAHLSNKGSREVGIMTVTYWRTDGHGVATELHFATRDEAIMVAQNILARGPYKVRLS